MQASLVPDVLPSPARSLDPGMCGHRAIGSSLVAAEISAHIHSPIRSHTDDGAPIGLVRSELAPLPDADTRFNR